MKAVDSSSEVGFNELLLCVRLNSSPLNFRGSPFVRIGHNQCFLFLLRYLHDQQTTQELDAATRNRYRLRLREAVRDPSAPRALVALVRMTEQKKAGMRSASEPVVHIVELLPTRVPGILR